MNDTPFLRQVEVLVGPLEEWKGGGAEASAIRFFGDGTASNLRIKFRVVRHIVTTANPTTIELYNLSAGTRKALRRPGAQVVLRVGWASVATGLVQIFKGSLLQVVHQRQGADLITTIMALAGFSGLSRALFFETRAPGLALKSLVLEMAETIPGVRIDPLRVKVADVSLGFSGWSWGGPTVLGLDDLARTYRFSWGVDDKGFYALDDSTAWKVTVRADSVNGLLKRAEPLLSGPMQTQRGVGVHSVLNPHIYPGIKVDVVSDANPDINGTYKVHTVDHSGDTHSPEWDTHLESWLEGKQLSEVLQYGF